MAIDPEVVWKTEFAKLPQDPTGTTSPTLIATFVLARVVGLATDPKSTTLSPPGIFTWIPTPFETALRQVALVPAVDPVTPATIIANGWSQSTLASQFLIAPATNFNQPAPGTNGIAGAVVCVIDPSSVAQGVQSIIKELVSAKPVANPLDAVLPIAIRKAFIGLRIIITGVDTTVPTPVPLVLTSNVI